MLPKHKVNILLNHRHNPMERKNSLTILILAMKSVPNLTRIDPSAMESRTALRGEREGWEDAAGRPGKPSRTGPHSPRQLVEGGANFPPPWQRERERMTLLLPPDG